MARPDMYPPTVDSGTDVSEPEEDVRVPDMGSTDIGSDMGPVPDSGEPDMVIDLCQGVDCQAGTCNPQTGLCVCEIGAALVNGRCVTTCPEHPGCRLYQLRQGSWQLFRIDNAGGPSVPIVAAFDIEGANLAYVFTRDRYYELNLLTRQWTDRGSNAPFFGGNTPATIHAAYSVPSTFPSGDPGFDSAMLMASFPGSVPAAFQSLFQGIATRTFEYDRAYDFSWDDPGDPSPTNMRASWLDVENQQQWVPVTAQCPVANRPVQGIVASGRVYFGEASGGACSGFSANFAYDSSPMFSISGAPPYNQLGATFYHAGDLWALTNP